MDNELSSMLSTLHSYRCEPCTYDMYEQFMKLNDSGSVLKKAIDKIKTMSRNSERFSKSISEEVNGVMQKYHKFQKSLTLYLKEAAVHH